MHETNSKMYAWNYVVPWHHTYSGYATAYSKEKVHWNSIPHGHMIDAG